MANVTIVKLKVRRGSDAQRKTIVLDQGEIGYTLDTRRLFVGDGSTFGGRSVGTKNIGPFTAVGDLGPDSSPGMQVGDIGYADSKLYMLTSTNYDNALSGYAYIGNLPDDSFLQFDDNNKLTIKPGAMDASYFTPGFFSTGLLSSWNGTNNVVSVNTNSAYFELSANTITPIANSITEREIKTTALSSGLIGGDNIPLKLNINSDQFEFDIDQKLSFKSVGTRTIPTSSWAGAEGSNLAGSGLSLNSSQNLQSDLRTVNNNTFSVTDGQISLFGATSSAQEFPFLTTRDGLIKQIQSSIFDVVTGISLSGQNTSSQIPIGAILPHAKAWENSIPAGFLLCNGGSYSRTEYADLFKVISTSYGSGDGSGNTFSVPALTGGGMESVLYGNAGEAPGNVGGDTKFLDGDTSSAGALLSALGVNYIIKYKEDPLLSIFNGAPNSISNGLVGSQNNQVYNGLNSDGAAVSLSSAGFITFALSGEVRNPDSEETFDKFAIPIFNY